MSYVLHVWETPVPESLAEATAIALDAGAERVGQNPGFIILAGRLTSRFPFAVEPPARSVWSDARMDGRTDARAWQIGVRRDHVRVISHLVVQANLLGLCVFDRQQGIAWLPGGVVLRAFDAAPLRPFDNAVRDDDRLTGFAATAGVQRLAQRVFLPLGYVFEEDGDETGYRLALPDGWIRVVPLVWDAHPGFRYSFVFEIRHDRSAEIAALFDEPGPAPQHALCSAIIHLRDVSPYQPGEFPVESVRRFRDDLVRLEKTFTERVLPLLESCRTLEGLERFVNRAGRVRSMRDSGAHYAHDIVMAWLVKRPDWAGIAEACLGAVAERREADRLKLERLVAYLHTADPANPNPLPQGWLERIAALLAGYDGSQRRQFACAGMARRASVDQDSDAFRQALVKQVLGAGNAPLTLVRDLFAEELACRAGKGDDPAAGLQALALRLLAQGGVAELSLVIKSFSLEQLRGWAGHAAGLAPAVTRDLVAACQHRARSLEYRAAKEAYLALARALAAPAAGPGVAQKAAS